MFKFQDFKPTDWVEIIKAIPLFLLSLAVLLAVYWGGGFSFKGFGIEFTRVGGQVVEGKTSADKAVKINDSADRQWIAQCDSGYTAVSGSCEAGGLPDKKTTVALQNFGSYSLKRPNDSWQCYWVSEVHAPRVTALCAPAR